MRMSRTTSSACSALRPRVNSRAATRPGRATGSSGTTTGRGSVRPDGSHGLCWRAGSVEATQVSLLVPSPRLEMTTESMSAPTRVSPPGSRRNPCPSSDPSATAKVRSTTGLATRVPSSATVGMVDGVTISWPTQSPGRASTRSRSASRSARPSRAGRTGRMPAAGCTGRSRSRSNPASTWLSPSGRPHHQLSGPGRASSSPSRAGAMSASRPARAGTLQDARAEGVHDGHPTPAHHLQQAGDPEQRVGPELDRVAPLVVHPTDDHVHRVEPGQRAQPDPVVLDHQVPPLDQGVAEERGQIGVFEVGLRQRTRGQDDHPGLVGPSGAARATPARMARKKPAWRSTPDVRWRLGRTRDRAERLTRA